MGFSAGAFDGILDYGMTSWHLCTFTSNSFFNSPRGRWLMHALAEGVFLIIFQILVGEREREGWGREEGRGRAEGERETERRQKGERERELGEKVERRGDAHCTTLHACAHTSSTPHACMQALYPNAGGRVKLVVVFFCFVLGNFVDMIHYVLVKYGDLAKGLFT